MATVVNKSTLELRLYANTPDFDPAEWWINPTLPQVDQRYWKNDAGTLSAMTEQEQATVDLERLSAAKQAKVAALLTDTERLIASRYPGPLRDQLLSMFTRSGFAGLTNRAAYLGQLATWVDAAATAWQTAVASVTAAQSLEAVAAVTVDDSFLADDPSVTITGALAIED